MPYIKEEVRNKLEPALTNLITQMSSVGSITLDETPIPEVEEIFAYVGLRLLIPLQHRFKFMSRGIAGLEAAIDEYKETVLRPYEAKKREENGDVV